MRMTASLAGLSLAMLLSSLGSSVANVALPTLEEDFAASFGAVRWVVIAYLLAVTTLVVAAGRLGDRVGHRRLLEIGVATFTLASALCAVAPALWPLVGARALQGIGAAAMMALTLALVAASVPRAGLGAAMGLLGSTSAIGTALGPSLGGVLIATSGWRAIFLVNVPLGVLTLGLIRRHLPADRRDPAGPRSPFDLAGTALLALALGAYALAMTAGEGRPGALTGGLLAAAVVAVGIFQAVERRVPAPLVGAAALADRGLRAGLLTSALVSTVMMATLVVGPFHLARALGLGPALVGLVMSVGPAVVALTGVPAGRMADRAGARRVTLAGLAAMGAGTLAMALVPVGWGVAGYLAAIVVTTLGYALFQTANTAAVMGAAGPERRGVTSGMLTLSRNLGLISGASAMGAVFALGAGTGGIASADPADIAAGTHVTFAVAAVLIAAAIVVVARVDPSRRAAALRFDAC